MTVERDSSLDMARGLIMVLMALDHTRIFFTSAQFDPVAIGETTPGYFVTRWITHLCAPGFFFLAGLGASLSERTGMSGLFSTFWLATRGAWLITLEFSVIAFAWSFTLGWSWLGVIASLGASMICLAALRWLPKALLGVVALAVIALHNAVPFADWIENAPLGALLYSAGIAATPIGDKVVLFPLVPWLAVMAAGYACGGWLTPDRRAEPRRFAAAGALLLIAFTLLRIGGAGAPQGGGIRRFDSAADTIISFFNVEKYPPSLQFICVTLGVLFLCIAAFAWLQRQRKERAELPRMGPLLAFGRVPFFFYLLHLYVIHGLALAAATVFDWPTAHLFWKGVGPNLVPPDGYGVGLWGVYLALGIAVAILYPACLWFARLKANHRSLWLKYL